MSVAVGATICALLALVLTNVMLGQAGFRVAELQGRIAEKTVDIEQIRLEVERMRAPASLAAKARRLGLVPGTQVTTIAPGTTSPVRGPSPVMGRD